MITITRKIEFDYGHRVLGHEGKCRHLHGHRGVAEITVTSLELDSIGRIIDFGEVNRIVGKWIDDNWDHNLLLNTDDPLLDHLWNTEEREPYVMKCNPTVENMAHELFVQSTRLLSLTVVSVRIWETPSCYADYRS